MTPSQTQSINTLTAMVDKVKPLMDKCKQLELAECAYALETFMQEMGKAIERDKRRLTRTAKQQSLATQTEKEVIDDKPRLF